MTNDMLHRCGCRVKFPHGTLVWRKRIASKSANNGDASKLYRRLLDSTSSISAQRSTWDLVTKEFYFHQHVRKYYDAETTVYDRIKELQGEDVPHLVDCFTLPWYPSPISPYARNVSAVSPCILLEFMDGFP